MRVLLFACSADEAQHLMRYGDRIQVAYLPSYDLEEIREEIERFNPNLVLCGADVFLGAYPAQPAGDAPSNKPDGAHTNAEVVNPSVAPREIKVLTMLAKGRTNDEIAKALRLSSRTVKRILTNLFERLSVNNRTELAGRAAELSLLERDD
jgi:DNA-binding NarL/FixJ family response regulator